MNAKLAMFALVAGLVLVGSVENAGAVTPPKPDAHPSACKKLKGKRYCKTHSVKAPVVYDVTWRVEVDPGDGTAPYAYFVKGTCTIPVRGPETCSITVTW